MRAMRSIKKRNRARLKSGLQTKNVKSFWTLGRPTGDDWGRGGEKKSKPDTLSFWGGGKGEGGTLGGKKRQDKWYSGLTKITGKIGTPDIGRLSLKRGGRAQLKVPLRSTRSGPLRRQKNRASKF